MTLPFLPNPRQQFFGNDGNPLAGGKLYTYAAGTSTPKATYTDTAGTIANTNPIVLNARGEATIYWDGAYKVTLTDAASATIYTQDNYQDMGAAITTALAASSGSSLVGFLQSGTGAVARTVQSKLRDEVSVKDFGAKGDGATDDTAAMTAAAAYINSTGSPVFVPPGTYLTDPLTLAPASYNAEGFFFGLEAASTIIKRRSAGASAFITMGASGATLYQANLVFRGLTIDGGVTTNGDAFVAYDLVRCRFDNVYFSGGSKACHLYGGICVTFDDCIFQNALHGMYIEKFTSSAGGGWPNINRLNNCQIVDNTTWGIWFDYGRMLVVNDCQVEGNGTTLAATQGGIYIGANTGAEVSVTDPVSLALICNGTWFEANRGIADVYLNSGINSVTDSNFFSQSTMVTNDIRIDGGLYRLRNLNVSFSKTTNVLENSGASVGNIIDCVQATNLSYSSAKTSLTTGAVAFLGNGAVPGVNGATSPLIQIGSDATSANPTITFPQAFKAATTPKIFLQSVDSGTGFTEAAQVTTASNTSFTVLKSRSTAGVQSTFNYTVNWVAIGENP